MAEQAQNPIQQIMALTTEVKAAKEARDLIQAEVKAHHKAIYMPMCVIKKDCEERYDLLSAKLKRLLKENSSLVNALRGV